jgi:hypothetical protein
MSEPCGKLGCNVEAPLFLADERLPPHCWCRDPGHRDPFVCSRAARKVACCNRVHPCRDLRPRGRNAGVVDPDVAASLHAWSSSTACLRGHHRGIWFESEWPATRRAPGAAARWNHTSAEACPRLIAYMASSA